GWLRLLLLGWGNLWTGRPNLASRRGSQRRTRHLPIRTSHFFTSGNELLVGFGLDRLCTSNLHFSLQRLRLWASLFLSLLDGNRPPVLHLAWCTSQSRENRRLHMSLLADGMLKSRAFLLLSRQGGWSLLVDRALLANDSRSNNG